MKGISKKRKVAKRVLNLLFVLSLIWGLMTGCGSVSDTKDGVAGKSSSQTKEGGNGKTSGGTGEWKIGFNFYNSSAYALIALRDNSIQTIEGFGGTPVAIDDETSAEKIIQDIENMISSGCDGILVWLPADQLFIPVAELCEKAKMPFVLNDKLPQDPEIIAELKANPYFVGAIGPANAIYGNSVAEFALEQGYKTCIVASGDVADPTDAPRLAVFKEKFESAGGIILEELHGSSVDMQTALENALIANPNPDFIYGTGPDFGNAACDALKGKGFDTVVLTSGLTSINLERLANPDSPMKMVNGDYWINGMLSAVIMQNYLDGTPLLDSNGQPIWYADVKPFEVSAEQFDLYQRFFLDQFMYTTDEIQQMSGANNPDFDYDAFIKVIEDYTLENRLKARFSEGKVTADEMKAAGIEIPQ